MYQKVLIPLDGSQEAESVVDMLKQELMPDAEVILLRVISPVETLAMGDQDVDGGQLEDFDRLEAFEYLRSVVDGLGEASERCICGVTVSKSVSMSIVDFASDEDVDLIAMYTHDRKGLASGRSIAANVERRAPMDVMVFRPAAVAAVLSGGRAFDRS